MSKMIRTGYSRVDKIADGLQSGELTVIAGRPSMGKSVFAIGMACNIVVCSNKNTALFSLEMSSEQLLLRLFSMKPYVNRDGIRLSCVEEDGNTILKITDRVDTGKIVINDKAEISIQELILECHKLKEKQDVQIVIIDYLQLMPLTSMDDRPREADISEISDSLKEMAHELDISVVALSQLSRIADQRPNHRPVLSDFTPKYGSLVDNSDLIMLIYRDDYYYKDSYQKEKAEIIVAKNNHGRTGTAEIAWISECCSFWELDAFDSRVLFFTISGTKNFYGGGILSQV